MQAHGKLGDLRRGAGDVDDAEGAAQGDRARVDRDQRTAGGFGDVGRLGTGAAEVGDVGRAFIGREGDTVRADADVDGGDHLARLEVDLGEGVRHGEGDVGEAAVLGQRDAQRIDVLGAAGDVDRTAPGELAVGRDLGDVEVRASARDDRGGAVGRDGQAVHGAAALRHRELGLGDQLEGCGFEGRQRRRGLEHEHLAALGEFDREEPPADVDQHAFRIELLAALQHFAGLHAGVHPSLVGHGRLLVDVGRRGGDERSGQQEPGGEGGAHGQRINPGGAAFKGAIRRFRPEIGPIAFACACTLARFRSTPA